MKHHCLKTMVNSNLPLPGTTNSINLSATFNPTTHRSSTTRSNQNPPSKKLHSTRYRTSHLLFPLPESKPSSTSTTSTQSHRKMHTSKLTTPEALTVLAPTPNAPQAIRPTGHSLPRPKLKPPRAGSITVPTNRAENSPRIVSRFQIYTPPPATRSTGDNTVKTKSHPGREPILTRRSSSAQSCSQGQNRRTGLASPRWNHATGALRLSAPCNMP